MYMNVPSVAKPPYGDDRLYAVPLWTFSTAQVPVGWDCANAGSWARTTTRQTVRWDEILKLTPTSIRRTRLHVVLQAWHTTADFLYRPRLGPGWRSFDPGSSMATTPEENRPLQEMLRWL